MFYENEKSERAMKKIDKKSCIPLYYQLMEIIIEQIQIGKLRERDQLLSERELCEKYNISRATVRQAIQELEKEGYIYKQHGKGTFVSPKEFKQDLLKFYSFSEEMKKLGKVPTSKVINFDLIQSDEETAKKLEIPVGDIVYKFTRLRLANAEPMMVETTCLPYNRFPNITQSDLEKEALYDILSNRFHVSFAKAEEEFRAVYVRKQEAELLNYTEGHPSMLIERITFEKDAVVEYTVGVARGDKFKYRVVLNKT